MNYRETTNTIAGHIRDGLTIRGSKVRFVSMFNVFHGEVSHQNEYGEIIAVGRDLFGPKKIKGPAWNFELE
jgi:hypothetical protein